ILIYNYDRQNVCRADLSNGMQYLVCTSTLGFYGSHVIHDVKDQIEYQIGPEPLVTQAFQQPNYTINAIAFATGVSFTSPTNHINISLPQVQPLYLTQDVYLNVFIPIDTAGVAITAIGVQVIAFTWPNAPIIP